MFVRLHGKTVIMLHLIAETPGILGTKTFYSNFGIVPCGVA